MILAPAVGVSSRFFGADVSLSAGLSPLGNFFRPPSVGGLIGSPGLTGGPPIGAPTDAAPQQPPPDVAPQQPPEEAPQPQLSRWKRPRSRSNRPGFSHSLHAGAA